MEYLERVKAFVEDKIRPLGLTLGQRYNIERCIPVERKNEQGWSGHLERAKAIIDGKVDSIRFKTLTLSQLQKSERWHPVGTAGEEMWNHGERVLAFEDGTLAFKESGADLLEALDIANDMARWISLLDKFDEKWESGPPSKIPVWKIH